MTGPPEIGAVYQLRVADLVVAVQADDASLRLAPGAPVARFLDAGGPADARIAARLGDTAPAPDGELLFEAAPLWRLHRDGERLHFRFFSDAHGRLPYREAWLAPDFCRGDVVLRRELFEATGEVDPLEYPLGELLLQGLLARGRGAELHACGVIRRGRGLLFVGQSGAGKTTVARLWQAAGGAVVASDDRIVVRRERGGFVLHGTPWHGEAEFAEPASAPVAAVFFLAQAPENAATPVSAGPAAARLFACGFPPFWDRAGVDFTLGFLGELADSVPCVELGFVPDASVVEFAAAAVGA